MGRIMIVVIDEHGGADKTFTGRSDAADPRVLMTGFGSKHILGIPGALAPYAAGIA